MIHIIFAGDSFSANSTDNFNIDNIIKNNFSFESIIGNSGCIPIFTFFALDLIKQNKNIRIHTIGRASYGNHVISAKFKNKVSQIQEECKDDKIYGIIQLSGLVRHGLSYDVDINTKDYPYDYIDTNTNIKTEKEIFEKHFDNIENLDLFCKENNIEKYIYFGWANIFQSDIREHNLYERIERIKKIVSFHIYEEVDDEMEYYCCGKKPTNYISSFLFGNNKLHKIFGDLYGGLTEYARTKLPLGRRYIFLFDPHPGTSANYIFYNDLIRKWLINQNIIDNISLEKDVENKINVICDFEYNRSIILGVKSNLKYFFDIMTITQHLVNKNIILDIEECKRIFYNLNEDIKNGDEENIRKTINLLSYKTK